ncbi:hypothetical protein OG979_22305 [Actinomadura citrea]|uniref:hypothetical protein n=1 Tax=Actinomadura citrea TaxID=46158 RepID=UPI002E2E09F9|nr:hypothetical protein [Actinomadura citrea]
MADELRIEIPGAAGLQEPSRIALEKAITDHGRRVLTDAESIENARRLSPGTPMITDAAIALADLNARNGQLRQQVPVKAKMMSTVGYIATFASGGFAGYIAKPVGAIGFAVCAVIGVMMHTWKKSDGE